MREIPAVFRPAVSRIERGLRRAGLSANKLTLAALGASALAGIAFALGWSVAGGVLVFLGGLADLFDGRVARASGAASPRGALLDSVCDRWGEWFVFAGLALHLPGGVPLGCALAALGASFLVSYTRARAEALGVELRHVGFLQRPERIVAIGAAAIATPLLGDWALVGALAAIAIAGVATALWRLLYAYVRLDGGALADRSARRSPPARDVTSLGESLRR